MDLAFDLLRKDGVREDGSSYRNMPNKSRGIRSRGEVRVKG